MNEFPNRNKEQPETAIPMILMELLKGKLNTVMVGAVTEFDGKNRVSVQPVIKRKFTGQDPKPLPPIGDVPLVFPGAGSYFITFDIPVGSWVILLCSQRSIDAWKNSSDGGVVEASTNRIFSMSDAIAIPGIIPWGASFEVGPGIQLRNVEGTVYIKVDGEEIKLENSGGHITLKDGGQVSINGHLTVDP